MKRAMISLMATVALAAALGASAFGGTAAANTLVIDHVMKGCHIWALNGGTPAVSQTLRLHPGQSVTLRNNDVMPHQLVKLTGPAVTMRLLAAGVASSGTLKAPYAVGMMPHTASLLRVSFPKAGIYTLRTKAGEDYVSGIKTIGEDNVLRLKVIVK
jgi:plastocyanin